MASKRFKFKTCVYCNSRQSDGPDHVFPREFFLPHDRKNLPKVPSCKPCNNHKSICEHYLSAVLPFGARHSHAKQNLRSMVPKRLSGNARLTRELQKSFDTAPLSLPPIGFSRAIQFDHEKLETWLKYVASGLMWYEFKQYIPASYDIQTIALNNIFENQFRKIMQLNGHRVTRRVGADVVRYEAVASKTDYGIGFIHIVLYGGATFTEDAAMSRDTASSFGIMIGPHESSDTAT